MWIMVKPRRLTAAFVKAVKVPGRYGDGRGGFGLFLRVHQTGDGRITKSWCQRIRPPHGKPTNIGLGGFPVVSLAEARGEALANRQEIQRGRHPREQGVPTFEEAAAKVIKQRAKGWKPGTTLRQQWEASLRTYAFPSIGHKPVSEVRRGDVLAIVAPIWSSRPAAAKLLLQRVRLVLRWSIAAGHAERNVARSIEAGLPQQNGPARHHRALPPAEVPAALAKVRNSAAPTAIRLAVEMAILTACRVSEVTGMRWSEADLAAKVWTVPDSRMKAKREHRVPLSGRALEVLHEARRLHGGDLVFPGPRSGKPLASATLGGLLARLGIDGTTLHGLARTTFRSWAAEQGVAREVAEAALAHIVPGTEGAYMRSDLFERRRRLMDDWAQYTGELHNP